MEEVEIKLADGETARVQKADGTWQLVEPAKAPADESELTSITTSLASLEVQRVVDPNAADVKQYGLEPARIAVAFRSKGQKDPRRIELGEKTPTGGDLYARVAGEKRVFLVSSFLESTFNKTPFALRDKTILKIERDKADSLELLDGSTSIQLAKKGSDWITRQACRRARRLRRGGGRARAPRLRADGRHHRSRSSEPGEIRSR